jgi:hypothetical protein
MHWCAEETAAVMTGLGSVGIALTWFRLKARHLWRTIKTWRQGDSSSDDSVRTRAQ